MLLCVTISVMISVRPISKTGEMVDIAVKLGIVNKSVAWFSYGDVRLGQGRDNAKEYFKANPALAKEVEDKVFAAMEKAKAEGLNPLGPERKKGKTVLSTASPAAEAPAAEQPAEKPATKRRNANIDIDVE